MRSKSDQRVFEKCQNCTNIKLRNWRKILRLFGQFLNTVIHYKTWHICGWPIRKNNRICQLDNPIWFTFVNEKRNVHRPLEKKVYFLQDFFFWHRPHSFFNLLELKNERLERKIFSICCVVIQAKWPFRYERPLHLSVKREGFFPPQKKREGGNVPAKK